MLKWPCSSLVKEHDFYPGTEQMLWGACMLLPTQCPRLVQTPLAIAERVRKDGAKGPAGGAVHMEAMDPSRCAYLFSSLSPPQIAPSQAFLA